MGLILSNSTLLSMVDNAHNIGQFSDIMELTTGCDSSYSVECVQGQIMYRASMALFVTAILLATLSVLTKSRCKGRWPLKTFFLNSLLLVLIVWVPNSAFDYWASAARILSLPWLLFQGLVVLDWAYATHDFLNLQAERPSGVFQNVLALIWRSMYLILTACMIGANIAMMIRIQSADLECGSTLSYSLLLCTACWGVLCTGISMTSIVGTGLLPPSAAFAYSTLLLWHYFPMIQQSYLCSDETILDNYSASQILLVLLFCTLARCTFHKGGILGLLGMPAQAQNSTGSPTRLLPPQGYVSEEGMVEDLGMCSLLVFSSFALAMLATNWANTDGIQQSGEDSIVFWEVLVSQIGTALMHGLALWTSYREDVTFAAYTQI
jgi:hypothetical protein